jgi:death-on-curing protein
VTEFLDHRDALIIAEMATSARVDVRDHGLLASALARPQTSVFGEDAYPDVHEKAAALLHSLARNHSLVDGNKRLAWLATYVFLDLAGHAPITTDDEVVEFVQAVAAGELTELPEIAARLKSWS